MYNKFLSCIKEKKVWLNCFFIFIENKKKIRIKIYFVILKRNVIKRLLI